MTGRDRRLIVDETLGSFFKQKFEEALRENGVETTNTAQFYIWNLLLHPPEEIDRKRAKLPLAIIYNQLQDKGVGSWQSVADFKQVGDICLLVAGFWQTSLARSLINPSYLIGLGSSAYGHASRAKTGLSEVLEELSDCFKEITNVLVEMSIILDASRLSDSELLRMYETQIRTRNETLARILARYGIVPPPIGPGKIH